MVKFLTAKEAVSFIKDGDSIATNGFVCSGLCEEILVEIENSFLKNKSPRDLTLYFAAGQGDGDSAGLNHLGHEGLLKRVVGGHYNLCPKIQKLIIENKVEGYNFPQGVMSHMFRDASSKKPGTYTKVGLMTFVDPDLDGGKLNSITKENLVDKIEITKDEFLFYKSPNLNVALIRATYSDELGNITFENEANITDAVSLAIACKNNNGTVIVQVEKIVASGSLDPKLVKIASSMVDIVVETSDINKYHKQIFGEKFNPSFCGTKRSVLSKETPPKLDNRKIIGRRSAMMVVKNMVINLGIGIPELVASVLNEEGQNGKITLTVESGLHGGVPQGGAKFGAAINPSIIMDQDRQFDFYDGGGLDMTFLGLAQCDHKGNVNVSKFGPRIAGCGGFINISQNTKNIVFCGTFTAGGLIEKIENGKLVIKKEGTNKKFIKSVEQVTFSSDYAIKTNQDVTYITERCVFKLTKDGLKIVEIAPGIDLLKDILYQMEFTPIVSENLKTMDLSIFTDQKMNLVI